MTAEGPQMSVCSLVNGLRLVIEEEENGSLCIFPCKHESHISRMEWNLQTKEYEKSLTCDEEHHWKHGLV